MYAPGRGAGRGGGGGGGVNALLQRASSQLKGERTMQKSQEFLSDDEEDNLDAYFKTLKTKQASAVKWDAFDESDVSLGSDATPVPDVGASGSRFLKKKAPPKIEESPKPKSIALKKGTNDNNKVPKALQSAYSTMHLKQQKTSRVVLSDSDMSISLDEDVLAQIKPQSSANTVASLKAKQEEWKSERIESHDADEVEDDFFNELNLATVDDLLGRKMESDGDDLSEVLTAGHHSSETRDHTARSVRSTTPLRSILSPSPRPTPRLSGSRVRLSLDNVEEVSYRPRSSSPEMISTARRSYSQENLSESDVADTINTEESSEDDYYSDYTITSGRSSPERQPSTKWKNESEYSEDFTNYSQGTSRSIRRYSRNLSTTDTDHYSDDFASFTTEQASDISRTSSPELKPVRSTKMKSREVQTGLDVGLHYHWTTDSVPAALDCNYRMSHVDPTPIAAHVVSSEALETMTAYSPNVLLLNDMMKQQLNMTNQFLDSQKRLYGSLVQSLFGAEGSMVSEKYTTMAEYKQYVKKHKKPVISFEEALRQVKDEMGLH
ncbi:hypothetical protein CAPTEDRAFT_215105 [Capitella teleta]|uniref:DUF4614 domain-containing protein n=1 Tax=Capitella teleta TaxID=283909 RepID=R7UJQ7_CAPTE|nr:hypothetical protein CAPTEDRAFT_215105 [Capitella teleta]|eukprot:ELU06445.1 hypothetical protein CAPTEDRAFT_215105 [Capitella teleta]